MALTKCPDCGKQVEANAEHCPYCGAALPQNGQESSERKIQPLTVANMKQYGAKAIAVFGLTLICYFAWRLIMTNRMSIFGEYSKLAFDAVASAVLGRSIILVAIGALDFFAYSIIARAAKKPIVFCVIVVALCAIGALLFSAVDESAFHTLGTPEVAAQATIINRWTVFAYGFGLPVLQGAIYIALCAHNLKRAVKDAGITVGIFLVASFAGMIMMQRQAILSNMGSAFGIVSLLFGSIVALVVSAILNRRKPV